jgi:hypothetical protein
MRVLIGCEFSGIVREAFRRRGHDAWSCDFLPTEIPGAHYRGDVLKLLCGNWDMAIFHPPCTFLSNAGARHLYAGGKLNPHRFSIGLDAKKFFMLLYNSGISKIAIENPIPSSVFELPAYDQTIQPFYFGHPMKKKTCLWLRNLPPLFSTIICSDRESTRIPGNWYNKGGKDRQRNRSRTFPGIADAMADQWGIR